MGISRDEFPALPEFADDRSFTIEQSTLAECCGAFPMPSLRMKPATCSMEVFYFLKLEYADGSGKLSFFGIDGRDWRR